MNWLELARRLAPLVGAALLAVLLLVIVPGSCRRERAAEATARVEQGAAKAASDSGRDAVETVGRAAARREAGEAITRTNDKEIHDAPGADAKVAIAVRDAGIDGLCRRDAYRDEPRCGVRRAAPARMESRGRAGAPLPIGDTVGEWVAFADAQTGRLDEANGRTRDTIAIVERCEGRSADEIKRARRGWLRRLVG